MSFAAAVEDVVQARSLPDGRIVERFTWLPSRDTLDTVAYGGDRRLPGLRDDDRPRQLVGEHRLVVGGLGPQGDERARDVAGLRRVPPPPEPARWWCPWRSSSSSGSSWSSSPTRGTLVPGAPQLQRAVGGSRRRPGRARAGPPRRRRSPAGNRTSVRRLVHTPRAVHRRRAACPPPGRRGPRARPRCPTLSRGPETPTHYMLLCMSPPHHYRSWFGVDSAAAPRYSTGMPCCLGRDRLRRPRQRTDDRGPREATEAPEPRDATPGAATRPGPGKARRRSRRRSGSDGGGRTARSRTRRAAPVAGTGGEPPAREEEHAQHGSSRTRRRPGTPPGRQARERRKAAGTRAAARPARGARPPDAPRPSWSGPTPRSPRPPRSGPARRSGGGGEEALRFTGEVGSARPHVRAPLDTSGSTTRSPCNALIGNEFSGASSSSSRRMSRSPASWSQLATNVVVSNFGPPHAGARDQRPPADRPRRRHDRRLGEAQRYFATPEDLEAFRASSRTSSSTRR